MKPDSKEQKVIWLTKKIIRSKILLRLRTQKEEERNRRSGLIKGKLFRNADFKKAKRVMFYIPFDGEVDTKEMIKKAEKLGKIIAVPVCKDKRTIVPCVYRENAHVKNGPYGVPEPAIKRFIALQDIDLVIVPGVAFDKKGNRLGRGKGCYDIFLDKLPKKTAIIGLAFDFQILPSVPATLTDIPVKKVLFS